jgi:hypothetical protein
MAQAYNPSYSGGRDQEDCSSKPPHVNSSQDPILKKPITKIGEGPEFKLQYYLKKTNKLRAEGE